MTTQLTAAQIKEMSAEDLLGLSFEDIPDAPDFINAPDGIYICDMLTSMDTYERKDKQTGEEVEDVKLRCSFTLVEAVDLKEGTKGSMTEEETPPKQGDKFSIMYFSKMGIQQFAGDLRDVAKEMGAENIPEFIAQNTDQSVRVVVEVERRQRKIKDKDTGEERIMVNNQIKACNLHTSE